MVIEKLNIFDEMVIVMRQLNQLPLPDYGELASKEFVQGTDDVITRLKGISNLEYKLTDKEKETLIASLKGVDWSEQDIEWVFKLSKAIVSLGYEAEYKLIGGCNQ